MSISGIGGMFATFLTSKIINYLGNVKKVIDGRQLLLIELF